MSPTEALAIIEAELRLSVRTNPDHCQTTGRALDVLRARVTPKPRAKACPHARAALKALSGIGIHVNEHSAYLDTFGPAGSPEREAQERRLASLPSYSQFAYEGMPAKLAKDEGAARMFLQGRMAQMEADDEAARVWREAEAERRAARARADKAQREVSTLRYWAYRYAHPEDPAVRARVAA